MSYGRIRDILVALCLLIALLWFFNLPGLQDAPRADGASWSWLRNASADVLNGTLGFQDVLVINLPSRPDRRDRMALAGAATGITFDWVDGVSGSDVPDRIRPADGVGKRIRDGNKGSWRAHMNALREVVERNLTSALILEDDIDWDVRLKSQLRAFSVASRGYLRTLRSQAADAASSSSSPPSSSMPSPVHSISVTELPDTISHDNASPYGDGWDVLWLGHCGTDFPPESPSSSSHPPSSPSPPSSSESPSPGRQPVLSPLASHDPARLPELRVAIPGDATVPGQREALRPHPLARPDEALAEAYAPHTRVVHAASGTVCTQGYAVSQRGARRLLWLFGTRTMTAGWDLMLRDWCDGYYRDAEGGGEEEKTRNSGHSRDGGRVPMCLTVQPPLFSQRYGESGESDITAPGGGMLSSKESSPYIRLSIKANLGRLARGDRIEDLVDQWPDGEE